MKSLIVSLGRIWFFSVLPLVTVVLVVLTFVLLSAKHTDNLQINSLSQDNIKLWNALAASEIKNQRLTQELKSVSVRLNETAIALNHKSQELNNALVPQATVTAAFKEQVVAPVVETTSSMWTTVKDSSLTAWNHVFN